MEGLGLQEVKKNDQGAICRGDTGDNNSAIHVTISLPAVKWIADHEEGVSEEDDSFEEVLLASGPTMMMEPELDHMLNVEASTGTLEQVGQEGIPLELLHNV